MEPAYYLGFDPGGVGAFGWAVATRDAGGPTPRLVASGCAPNAQVAVHEALAWLPPAGVPVAAGIDAPLFWTPTGVRQADAAVRRELHARGARSPGGTVQQLNSLRGACLVQGVAAAMLLRRRAPNVLITETHPKALLWHLGLATPEHPPSAVRLRQLAALLSADVGALSEHERDAAISCAAAIAFHERRPGWHDLVGQEPDALLLIPGGVAYWMPARSNGGAAERGVAADAVRGVGSAPPSAASRLGVVAPASPRC